MNDYPNYLVTLEVEEQEHMSYHTILKTKNKDMEHNSTTKSKNSSNSKTGATPKERQDTMTKTVTDPKTKLNNTPDLAEQENPCPVLSNSASNKLTPPQIEQINQILAAPYFYMDNESFHLKNAKKNIIDSKPELTHLNTSWYQSVLNNLGHTTSSKATTAKLDHEQEQAIFYKLNFCKFKVAQIIEKATYHQTDITVSKAAEILQWHNAAESYEHQIAQVNLALVLAMAKRSYVKDIDYSDLVSEGNMALLRAIDKFDAGKGFKFSTYACRAILKSFSRVSMKQSRYRQRFPTEFDPTMERSNYTEEKRKSHNDDCAEDVKEILIQNKANLTNVEVSVIEHRFAIGNYQQTHEDAKPLTLEQVGKIIGVTKERVRQIQNKALKKIKKQMVDNYL